MKLEDKIIQALSKRHQTIAVAESLTSGYLVARLIAGYGASVVVKGGVVAYTLDIKDKILGVPFEHSLQTNAVDERTARIMSENVSKLMDADYGLATTGIIEPYDERPAQVFIAVYERQSTESFLKHEILSDRFNGQTLRNMVNDLALQFLDSVIEKVQGS